MSLRFLLDTNTISEPIKSRRNQNVLHRLAVHRSETAIASVVWQELWYGYERMAASQRRVVVGVYLTEIVAHLPILPYDQTAAMWHARERARLTAIGRTPPFADSQIAAMAFSHDLILVTANLTDFAGFTGIQIDNWFAVQG